MNTKQLINQLVETISKAQFSTLYKDVKIVEAGTGEELGTLLAVHITDINGTAGIQLRVSTPKFKEMRSQVLQDIAMCDQ